MRAASAVRARVLFLGEFVPAVARSRQGKRDKRVPHVRKGPPLHAVALAGAGRHRPHSPLGAGEAWRLRWRLAMVASFFVSDIACDRTNHAPSEECNYRVAWAINPHMQVGAVDVDAAGSQHSAFVRLLGRNVSTRLRQQVRKFYEAMAAPTGSPVGLALRETVKASRGLMSTTGGGNATRGGPLGKRSGWET